MPLGTSSSTCVMENSESPSATCARLSPLSSISSVFTHISIPPMAPLMPKAARYAKG